MGGGGGGRSVKEIKKAETTESSSSVLCAYFSHKMKSLMVQLIWYFSTAIAAVWCFVWFLSPVTNGHQCDQLSHCRTLLQSRNPLQPTGPKTC